MAPRNNKRKPTQSPARHRRVPTPPPPPPPSPPPPSENDPIKVIIDAINELTDSEFDALLQEIVTFVSDDTLAKARLKYVPKSVDSAVQTEPQPTDTEMETPPLPAKKITPPEPVKSYATVAATSINESMDLDPPPPALTSPPAETPAKAPKKKQPVPPPPVMTRAIVIHGVHANAPLSQTVRRVEVETRRAAIGARWLLSAERRNGKKASSVVVFFFTAVKVPGFLLFGGKKYRVEEYEWGRPNKTRVPWG